MWTIVHMLACAYHARRVHKRAQWVQVLTVRAHRGIMVTVGYVSYLVDWVVNVCGIVLLVMLVVMMGMLLPSGIPVGSCGSPMR